jgi:hypothetical protein
MKRRLAVALAAYAVLGAAALAGLDGFLRVAVFIFLAGLVIRTIRASDEEPMD